MSSQTSTQLGDTPDHWELAKHALLKSPVKFKHRKEKMSSKRRKNKAISANLHKTIFLSGHPCRAKNQKITLKFVIQCTGIGYGAIKVCVTIVIAELAVLDGDGFTAVHD